MTLERAGRAAVLLRWVTLMHCNPTVDHLYGASNTDVYVWALDTGRCRSRQPMRPAATRKPMHACSHPSTHTRARAHTHTHTLACVNTCSHSPLHTHAHTCTHACLSQPPHPRARLCSVASSAHPSVCTLQSMIFALHRILRTMRNCHAQTLLSMQASPLTPHVHIPMARRRQFAMSGASIRTGLCARACVYL